MYGAVIRYLYTYPRKWKVGISIAFCAAFLVTKPRFWSQTPIALYLRITTQWAIQTSGQIQNCAKYASHTDVFLGDHRVYSNSSGNPVPFEGLSCLQKVAVVFAGHILWVSLRCNDEFSEFMTYSAHRWEGEALLQSCSRVLLCIFVSTETQAG
jgi:hypothetical protein